MTEFDESAGPANTTYTAASVGRTLAAAREAAGLSVDQAAAMLRLSRRQVEAIEAGDMEALPGPAFARGFVRNYAKLLQIDSDPLMEAFGTQAADIGGAHIGGLQMENIVIESARNHGRWRVYALVILLIAAVGLGLAWYRNYQATPVANTATEAMPIAQDSTALVLPIPLSADTGSGQAADSAVDGANAVAEQDGASPAPVAGAGEPEPVAPASADNAEEAVAASGTQAPADGSSLTLTFTEESWASVHDKDGKEIFSRTMSAGSSEVIEGTPPLNVVLGNAKGTQVSYNGKPVDLTLHVKGNVARFTLE